MRTVNARGIEIPVIGFGTWEVTGDSAYDSVRTALDAGYRHIDTAQAYGNEEEVGRAIADSDVDRDEIFLTTKVWISNAAPDDVRSSHADSLRRLGVDAVDLLLLHWPSDAAPIEATIEAMDGLREDGQTRLIGVSNFPSGSLRRALQAGPVATNQVEYHPFLSQEPVLEVLREHDLPLTAYSPLANGKAIGDESLDRIAQRLGVSTAQVAIAWLLRQGDVIALPRSENPDHIRDNLAALDLELDDEAVREIDALPKDRRMIDPGFAPDWD